MLDITTRESLVNSIYTGEHILGEHRFDCPYCGGENIYYSKIYICDWCNLILPDIESMRKNRSKRIGYFIFGEEDA